MALSHLTDFVGLVLAGRYRLLAPVGAGASAQVYLADDVHLRRRVAVKVLHAALADDPVFLRRFQAEAQAAAALNHPNILAAYDWGHDGVPFLVTEYLDGGSLRAVLDRTGPLSLSQTLMVGLEAARGLHYAHRRGFVHRDIKPPNLLFGEDARLRVVDFGLARALAEAAWTEPEGVVLGTAKYVSPEQAAGAQLDGRSDVYSLALALVECATGTVPHLGDSAVATLQARIGRAIEPPASLGPLAAVLAAAGTADPDERSTAAELGKALMAVASQLPSPTPLALAPPVDDDQLRAAEGSTALYRTPASFRPDGRAAPFATGRSSVIDLRGPGRVGGPGRSPAVGGGDAEPGAGSATGTGELERTQPHGSPRAQRRRRAARRRKATLAAMALLGAGAVSLLVVSGSLNDVVDQGPVEHPVADYADRDVDAVRSEADRNSWTVQTIESFSATAEPGRVIAQRPGPDSELVEGGELVLTVSKGPAPIRVPDGLVGLTEAEATQRVRQSGLTVLVEGRFDEDKVAGSVLEVPDTGRELANGAPVKLVVSKGAAPRTMPDVEGTERGEADAALAALGLVVVDGGAEYSETVEAGYVIRASAQPGAELSKGAEVTLVSSLGREPITIPDLRGATPADAADTLEALGLVVEQEGPANREVLTTDPEPGAVRYRGDIVTVISRRN